MAAYLPITPENHGEDPNQFPLRVLPPRIRAAVVEAIAATQAPAALVASSALAAASLSVQSKFDVRRFDGLVSPCSLYFITFAESGERKTSVDRIFFDTFNQFEFSCSKSPARTDEDGQELILASGRRKIRLLYSDTTPAAFIAGLAKNSRAAGLCEDEAGRIFSSRLIDDLGLLNKLWDGNTIAVDRRYESIAIQGPRCSISWMVQPAIFKKYLNRKGEDARGIGFLARCLVSYPESTQGYRLLRRQPTCRDASKKFSDRVIELLESQKELLCSDYGECDDQKVELSFDSLAQAEWEQVFNAIEHEIKPGGQFCETRDYASKVAENIARLAAVFHAFEGYKGTNISSESLISASTVLLWYTREFVRLFSPPEPQELISSYAGELDKWLIKYVQSTGSLILNRNDLLQMGPNRLRKRAILDIALQRLIDTNRVCFGIDFRNTYGQPSRKATQTVQLNDAYYTKLARGYEPYGFAPI